MINIDFTNSKDVRISRPEDGKMELKGRIPSYVVEFLRELSECPGCGSTRIHDKRSSSHNIFAMVEDGPAYCALYRKEYYCRNKDCTLDHCFYNTHGSEDGYFVRKGCSYYFVYFILETWLSKKTLSFDDIRDEYGVSGSEANKWSLSLRHEFESHIPVPAQTVMIFCSFTDKDGRKRGFVCHPDRDFVRRTEIRLLSFIDDYTPSGLDSFYKRVDNVNRINRIYYHGSPSIGTKLQELFNQTAYPADKANDIAKVWKLRKDIIELVNKKDSYDAIVIKYLYDTRACKEKILNAMKTIAKNYGSRKIDFKSGTGPALGLLFDREARVKDLCKEFSELPEVSNYYAIYK